MKTTYINKSQIIYKRAMDLAAEKIAFHQARVEESKSLFSLCERLLGEAEEPNAQNSIEHQEEESKSSTRDKPIAILNTILPHMSSKPQKSAEIMKAAGVTAVKFNYFVAHYKKYLKITPKGFVPYKDYMLNSRGLAAKKRIKEIIPFGSSSIKIAEVVKHKYASSNAIANETGLSKSSVLNWIKKNIKELNIKMAPSAREGWSIKTYKLK
jgi:hypothetical protein